ATSERAAAGSGQGPAAPPALAAAARDAPGTRGISGATTCGPPGRLLRGSDGSAKHH
ncbi:hypothetical protein MNEG_13123, partial [Monoraphidium neglectum]